MIAAGNIARNRPHGGRNLRNCCEQSIHVRPAKDIAAARGRGKHEKGEYGKAFFDRSSRSGPKVAEKQLQRGVHRSIAELVTIIAVGCYKDQPIPEP